jgi:thioredoxin 1
MKRRQQSRTKTVFSNFGIGTAAAAAMVLCLGTTGCSLGGKQIAGWPQAASVGGPSASDTAERSQPTATDGKKPPVPTEAEDDIALVSFEPAKPWHSGSRGRVSQVPFVDGAGAAQGVVRAGSDSFDKLVLQSEVPVLVDFYADWCRPCRALAPTLDELARDNPNVRVVKVDIDDSPDLADRYGVSSIPSLRVFKGGEVTARHLGRASREQLESLLAKAD